MRSRTAGARSAWLYLPTLDLRKPPLAQDPLLGYIRRAGRRSGKTSGGFFFGSCFPGGGSREKHGEFGTCLLEGGGLIF